ncbi:hypothetical protein IWZ03DRAFT_48410 [Phyllosticta citriasiana]|uniref:Uncharacterized protein n=1 Tax=Phyllosticta citriasiana TaxID=595635 RepID=A0ABR1KH48_9PEZI
MPCSSHARHTARSLREAAAAAADRRVGVQTSTCQPARHYPCTSSANISTAPCPPAKAVRHSRPSDLHEARAVDAQAGRRNPASTCRRPCIRAVRRGLRQTTPGRDLPRSKTRAGSGMVRLQLRQRLRGPFSLVKSTWLFVWAVSDASVRPRDRGGCLEEVAVGRAGPPRSRGISYRYGAVIGGRRMRKSKYRCIRNIMMQTTIFKGRLIAMLHNIICKTSYTGIETRPMTLDFFLLSSKSDSN